MNLKWYKFRYAFWAWLYTPLTFKQARDAVNNCKGFKPEDIGPRNHVLRDWDDMLFDVPF